MCLRQSTQEKASLVIEKKQSPVAFANDSLMTFKELIVTPLEIRLVFDDKRFSQGGPAELDPFIEYNKTKLLLGGYELDGSGGFWTMADGRHYLRFESPEWYQDWSRVPMQLVLSEMKVEERAAKQQLVKLTAPAAAKQTVSTNLHQFPVEFTYYKDGKDLIVESSSSEPLFGGIVQTYIEHGGKRLFAEMNPTPPGGNGTNKKIERYIQISDGDLMLNPFLYIWSDPNKIVQIPIN